MSFLIVQCQNKVTRVSHQSFSHIVLALIFNDAWRRRMEASADKDRERRRLATRGQIERKQTKRCSIPENIPSLLILYKETPTSSLKFVLKVVILWKQELKSLPQMHRSCEPLDQHHQISVRRLYTEPIRELLRRRANRHGRIANIQALKLAEARSYWHNRHEE